MRSETDQAQDLVVWLLVDQDQIRPHVAVAKVTPRAAQRMVVVACVEQNVVGKRVHDDREPFIEIVPVAAAGFASVVALEPTRPFNRPHAGREKGG